MWTWDKEKEELQFTGVATDIPVTEALITEEEEESPEQEEVEREKKDPKATGEEALITLEDVKEVALRIVKKDHICPKDFNHFLRLPIVDSLLSWTLRYFYYYFRELDFEQPFVTDRMGENERDYTLLELQKCLALCNQQLGEQYCNLLLGVGCVEYHHMRGGRGFMSHNLKDRSLYECLYALLIEAVHLSFGKKDHDIINEEIGRLVRSEAYNPTQDEDNASISLDEEEMERQPKQTKHFQQSPLLLCVLLPADKRPIHAPSGYEAHFGEAKKVKEEQSEILHMSDEQLIEFICKELENVGILGMKKSNFDDDLEMNVQS